MYVVTVHNAVCSKEHASLHVAHAWNFLRDDPHRTYQPVRLALCADALLMTSRTEQNASSRQVPPRVCLSS
jgi:hypothetical protein